MIGTSAHLREGDQITLNDLLYALMLPSGNDAAQSIANFIGKAIISSPSTMPSRRRPNIQESSVQENINKFVQYMNRLAYQLGLRHSNFSNAHGLSCKANRSSAADLGKLACMAIK